MKLFVRYNRINLFATLLIFLLSSMAFYLLLRYVLINQVDESLEIEQREIATFLQQYHRLPDPVPVKDQLITFRKVTGFTHHSQYRQAYLYDPFEHKTRPFRQYLFPVQLGTQQYEVTVSKSLENTDALTRAIIYITLGTLLLILVAGILINRMVLQQLWKPFYQSLSTIQTFRLGSQEPLHFPAVATDEFRLLNQVLQQATDQANKEYLLLKAFTENASHELQTPLAIIQSKLDLLIQDEHLSHHQSQAAMSAYESIQRLSRLNQSLLLLAKIENRQFADRAPLQLEEKIRSKLLQLEELVRDTALTIGTQLEPAVLHINASLADILLNNLLGNAIRHNHPQGHIELLLRPGLFLVRNTGPAQPLDKQRLFSRFYKGDASTANNGLGLSIVHQICLVSGCSLSYEYVEKMHVFCIRWA